MTEIAQSDVKNCNPSFDTFQEKFLHYNKNDYVAMTMLRFRDFKPTKYESALAEFVKPVAEKALKYMQEKCDEYYQELPKSIINEEGEEQPYEMTEDEKDKELKFNKLTVEALNVKWKYAWMFGGVNGVKETIKGRLSGKQYEKKFTGEHIKMVGVFDNKDEATEYVDNIKSSGDKDINDSTIFTALTNTYLPYIPITDEDHKEDMMKCIQRIDSMDKHLQDNFNHCILQDEIINQKKNDFKKLNETKKLELELINTKYDIDELIRNNDAREVPRRWKNTLGSNNKVVAYAYNRYEEQDEDWERLIVDRIIYEFLEEDIDTLKKEIKYFMGINLIKEECDKINDIFKPIWDFMKFKTFLDTFDFEEDDNHNVMFFRIIALEKDEKSVNEKMEQLSKLDNTTDMYASFKPWGTWLSLNPKMKDIDDRHHMHDKLEEWQTDKDAMTKGIETIKDDMDGQHIQINDADQDIFIKSKMNNETTQNVVLDVEEVDESDEDIGLGKVEEVDLVTELDKTDVNLLLPKSNDN